MVNIYRLQYIDKQEALIDLINKRVIDINDININGTQAVGECGIITLARN
jgi:hypothetical protein